MTATADPYDGTTYRHLTDAEDAAADLHAARAEVAVEVQTNAPAPTHRTLADYWASVPRYPLGFAPDSVADAEVPA